MLVRPDMKELPGVELSGWGCRMQRRFKAVESENKYLYMAAYEFDDIKAYVNYQNHLGRKEITADFERSFGERAAVFKRELKRFVWEQIHP